MTDIINVDGNVQEVRTAETIAIEINTIKKQTQRVMLSASIEIGRRLSEAKSMVSYGHWREWLQQNVNYSERTAQNLIKIYDEYDDKGMDALFGNDLKVFEELSYTQAVALLSLPTVEERKEFVAEHDMEEMSTREIQEAIKAQKEAEDKARDLQNRLKQETDKRKQAEREAAQHREESEKNEQFLKEKTAEADKLKHDLEEATVPAIDPEKEEKIKTLEAEVERLQKTVAADGDMKQFQIQLGIIQEAFNKMLTLIAGIEEEDKRKKFQGAAQKLLERLEALIR